MISESERLDSDGLSSLDNSGVLPKPPTAPLGVIRFLRMIRDNEISVFSAATFTNKFTEANILFQRFVVLNDPDFIKHVLVDNHANYSKGRLHLHMLSPLLGRGLLTSEGDFWRRQRRISAPAFHSSHIARLGGVMAECGADAIKRWREAAASGRPMDILPQMMTLTIEIIGKCLFSSDLGKSAADLGEAVSVVIKSFGKPSPLDLLGLPEWLPRRRDPAARAAVKLLERTIYDLIAARRDGRAKGDDLLTLLLEARDDSGRGMSDRQLRDEIITLFAAGHETTGLALTWMWYLLSQNPRVERRLHRELDTVLGGRRPRYDDLNALPYTRMVVEETLRLFPPAFAINRMALAEDRIGEHVIRKRTLITISPYVTHRNPRLWPSPTRFEPERFAPDQVAARPRFAYLPFGGGPRVCIGNAFAMMEATILLAQIAQEYRLLLDPRQRVEAQGLITLRPRFGMRMILEPRVPQRS